MSAVAVAVGAASCYACGAVAWWSRGTSRPDSRNQHEEPRATQPTEQQPAPQGTTEDTAVDFAAFNAALGPRVSGEEMLFQAWQPGAGTELDPGWRWVRRESGWCVSSQGQLLMRCAKSDASDTGENGMQNLLLRDFPSVERGCGRAAAVTVVHNGGKQLGEQAGLIWYHDDCNYLKLTLQVGQDGVVSVVLAVVVGGDVTYMSEKECPSTPAQSANLRIEVAPAGECIAGVLDLGYCDQLVGVCKNAVRLGLGGDQVQVGVMANGASCTEEEPSTQFATFSDFQLLSLAPDRVSFASDPNTSASLLQHMNEHISRAEENEFHAEHSFQGWTLSDDLSSTERDEVAELLSSVGPPSGDGQTMPTFTIVHNPH